jgi:GT2 family glycosyltransferase
MSENYKLTIIIVNWKTPRLLASSLRSIFADPEAEGFEIFVVDNNSNDDSVEILQSKFPTVRIIANNENVGFARACNQVIPNAQGKYVLLLNPDTRVVDGAITHLARYLDQNPACGAVGPKILNPDGSLQLACRRSFPTPETAFYRLSFLSRLFPRNRVLARYNLTNTDPDSESDVEVLSGSCMMVRKSAIDQIGLLDEDIFMFGEDIDWCWRFKQASWSVRYFPEAVVYHYHGAASRFRRVRSTLDLHKSMTVFYRKYFAPKHRFLFNVLVYFAIWTRGGVFAFLSVLQGLLPPKDAGVFGHDLDSHSVERHRGSRTAEHSHVAGVLKHPEQR